MGRKLKVLTNGLFNENPTFRLLLGMCPTLAVTTAAINGLGMGLSTTVVLIGSNVVISALRKVIPDAVRIPAFVVVIASFVTIVQMVLEAYVPSLYSALGIYIPLIVVNCIILGRAEAFAYSNTVGDSFFDGLGIGLGFTGALTILASIREIIGNGTIFGLSLFGSAYEPALLIIMPAGGFIVFGLLLGFINMLTNKHQDKAKKEAAALEKEVREEA